MEKFSIYYVNVRGLKSKMDSVQRILEDIQPEVICMTETHLGDGEKVELEGYEIYYNSNTKGKGGIVVGIQEKLKHITIETEKKKGAFETLWIKIDNTKNKINIGTIYAPQESRTKIKVFREMYKTINEKINNIKNDNEKMYLVGDFNAKVGDVIKGNKDEISKSGKILKDMILGQDLGLLNANHKCIGTWTRILGTEKSIIDYAMVLQGDEQYIKEIRIDDDKVDTPRYTRNKKTTYTDHCAIISEMNWTQANIDSNKNIQRRINEESLQQINSKTRGTVLTQIAQQNIPLNEKYTKWQREVTEIIESSKTKVKIRKKQELRCERKIKILKRNIRKKKADPSKKKAHINTLNRIIEEEIKKNNAKKIIKTAQSMSTEGTLKTGKFWEFKKKMDRQGKKETPSTMLDKKGIERNTKEEIKEIFEEFYEDLFKHEKPTNAMEELHERIIEHTFRNIQKQATKDKRKKKNTNTDTVKKCIAQIKNKKSSDSKGTSNVILKRAGEDMAKSIGILFTEIDNQDCSPEEWEDLIVKSIYKGKKSKKEMENRRGIFLTNTVSKLFEKIKQDAQRDMIEEGISRHQTGGIRDRSKDDNIMTFNAVIDYNNFIGSETYVLFADAYKCFDKLDLKTSIIDLKNILGSREAILQYNMNKKSNIVIDTPVGRSKKVEIGEIVKQGTLSGPVLCNINTDKVNRSGQKSITTIGPNVRVEALIYVDDIQQAGSHISTIEKTANNCAIMETSRHFTFNNKPDKTAFMIMNPKRETNVNKLKNKIKRGEIERTKEYVYVGEWYTERDSHAKRISEKDKKIGHMINKIKDHYGSPYKVGQLALQVRLFLYKTIAIPTLFINIETWSKVNNKEMEQLEKIQKEVLTALLEMPPGTPYRGVLAETGIWPIEQLFEYRRITKLKNILDSEDKRLLKEIIEDQIQNTFRGCWTEQTKEICNKYGLSIEHIRETTSQKLKNDLKKDINKRLNTEIQRQAKEKTKLRFCRNTNKKSYIEDLGFTEARLVMKVRLNMIEVRNNYKNQYEDRTCTLCKTEIDTTEHIFSCKKISMTQDKVSEIIYSGDGVTSSQSIEYLKEVMTLKGIDIFKKSKEIFRDDII